MSLSTAAIKTQAQRLYKESSTRYFDDNWFATAINDSVQDIWDEILSVNPEYAPVKLQQIGYISGQREYVLNSDFEQVEKNEVTDRGGPPFPQLLKISFEDVGAFVLPYPVFLQGTASSGQGEPLAFYIRFMENGQTPIGQASALTADSWVLGFDPIPARNATNNFNLWYVGTAGTISSTSTGTTPDLPPDFHDLIPRRVCVLMAIADQSPTLDFYRQVYNDSLLRKLNRVVRGPQTEDERIELDWLE